jgi:hypothetical protein
MTEQVLGAHPGVSTSGELTTITEVGAEFEKVVGASHDLAAMVRRLSVDGARHLRRFYWKSLEKIAHVDTDTPVYLDKLPLNIVQLGLINLVFPDARVIVALRDPRDVCLSCLFQNFMLNNAMIHFLTLESTVKYYSTVMDLYLHQRDMLSLDVIEVRYEDTVTWKRRRVACSTISRFRGTIGCSSSIRRVRPSVTSTRRVTRR